MLLKCQKRQVDTIHDRVNVTSAVLERAPYMAEEKTECLTEH